MTNLNPTTLIAIEVPADAEDFRVTYNHNFVEDINLSSWDITYLFDKTLRLRDYVCLNIQDDTIRFQILGEVTADEISFDVEPYVEKLENHYRFKDYFNGNYFDYPQLSFYSLLQSKGLYFENMIEKPKQKENCTSEGFGGYSISIKELDEWQESESKVIKGKLIIIKPI